MPRRLILAFASAALALAPVACTKEAAGPPPPPEVKVATVLQRDVPVYVEAIGQTRGSTEIEIRARVEGFIQSVDFEEGTLVRKGQLLYTIDPAPLQAALAEAKGARAEAEAQLARARQDVARYEPLVAKNAISRQEYETAVALERAARGSVEAAQAAVEGAQVNLAYTRVVAPEPGLVGKTEAYPGTLVGRGLPTLLTRISQIDTIHARFTIAEKDYLYYARKRNERVISGEKVDLTFDLVLGDGSVHPEPGRLVFVDRSVDPQTGTILLEAAFPNPGGIVRPGQYARVRVAVEVKKGALLVPQRSVQEMQGVYSVVVVTPDDTTDQRMVQPGQRLGALWVIDSGLQPGERIIVEGLMKVRPGLKVSATMVAIDEGAPAAAAATAPGGAGGGAER